ncbi:transposase [Bacillus timonensis]|uniref:Transposase n=1 Tax=Bacillus timonensis TaxID=1033734 RepID=A0A4S3PQ73_9BACI|nr:transposase [Bacillus timonensis]THE11355.1 transposase [Bacillus timonensis]
MPRVARIKSRSGIYHVILRGVNKQTIFEDDEDRTRFLNVLQRYKEISRYKFYAYSLMDNHIHLLIREMDEPIGHSIKRISSSYVYWYNMKYERCGHLFQERFRSEKVESKRYFLTVLRYIHQNPVKAGLAANVFEASWTSLNEYFGGAGLVDTEFGVSLFSGGEEKTALQRFVDYMSSPNTDECMEYLERVRLSDSEVREYLQEMGIPNKSALQRMERKKRDAVLLQLKETTGVSLRQISRVTGISKSVIQRV